MPQDPTAEPRRELTFRAIGTAIVVALIVGASYPYVVLKIGYGPNISVVSAFFGYLGLAFIGLLTGIRGTRHENNLVQTAGTAAGESGFMCVVLAAIDMLNMKPELGFSLHLNGWQIFWWLSIAGLIGVLLAVPLRRHFIDDEKLVFADGTATGETMLLLDLDKREAAIRLRALGVGGFLSAIVAFFREDGVVKLIPSEVAFGAHGAALRMGSEVSLLSFGSGLLVGLRITLSMALGMLVAWVISPPMLHSAGIVPEQTFREVLKWVMWPATGMLVSGGLTALFLKWRVIARSFTGLRASQASADEFPLRYVVIGVSVLTVALCGLQYFSLGFSPWLTLLSLLLSIPLMVVGIRVLGETNWAPISAMANMMQAVFAVISPGNMAINMIGSGMSGTIAGNGEHLMQDYRAGKIVGANNRHLTILQLIGVPIGAAAVAIAYPALRARYGFGAEGLSSPISVKWAGFAEILNKGFASLPSGAFQALLVALALGVVLSVLETLLTGPLKDWVPSPTGVGLGMLIPGYAIFPMVMGGIVQHVWMKAAPRNEETYNTPLAAGFIAGEALLVLALAIAAMFGVKI